MPGWRSGHALTEKVAHGVSGSVKDSLVRFWEPHPWSTEVPITSVKFLRLLKKVSYLEPTFYWQK